MPTWTLIVQKLKFATLNKKALSPIFATLIILAVVTVLFIPVFIWATGTSSQTQESWQQSGIAATERIVIEEVNLQSGAVPQSCTIYVRNIGDTVVTINDILIIEADSKVHTYQKIPISHPVPTSINQFQTVNPLTSGTPTPVESVTKGNLIEIRISDVRNGDPETPTLTITSGHLYTIKVFTTRGIGDTYKIVA